ncbi:MAG: pyruvate kinase, partial [Nitrososphaeraceae archaeon]
MARVQRSEDFEILGRELHSLYVNTIEYAEKTQSKIKFKSSKDEQRCSCDNLLCYLALRKHDLSDLQLRLAEEGLSSLGMIESNVLTSIEQVLKHFEIIPTNHGKLCKVTAQWGSLTLGNRTGLLFGSPGKGRRTRIMVTLDASDIFQYDLIEQLLENGLDLARINCAHNSKREWKLLIESIRIAEQRLIQRGKGIGHKCIILMDLGGPKIRTGPMEHKVGPLKISVLKDLHGRPVRFVEGFLDSEASQTELISLEGTPSSFVVAISKIEDGGLGSLKIGQKISFKDARDDRLRTFTVLERISPTKVRIGLEHTAYLNEGIKLECQLNSPVDNDSKCSFTIGRITPQAIEINVEAGNTLRLYRDNVKLGHSANKANGTPAGISCTHPEILDRVMIGHRVFIDDGKIEA